MSETGGPGGRGKRRTHLLIIGAVAIIAGVLSILLLNPSAPESVCAERGAPTSGFMDAEKNCAITMESFEAILEAESRPRWGNIAGSVLILGGVVTGLLGLRRRKLPNPPAA
ncbi:MAG TPA: hypothetical protein VF062_06025 [Candidatus Limnocylindrales bacterium]